MNTKNKWIYATRTLLGRECASFMKCREEEVLLGSQYELAIMVDGAVHLPAGPVHVSGEPGIDMLCPHREEAAQALPP